jgi:hypothetical protein
MREGGGDMTQAEEMGIEGEDEVIMVVERIRAQTAIVEEITARIIQGEAGISETDLTLNLVLVRYPISLRQPLRAQTNRVGDRSPPIHIGHIRICSLQKRHIHHLQSLTIKLALRSSESPRG